LVNNPVKELATFQKLHYEEDLVRTFVDFIQSRGDPVFDNALNMDFFGNGFLFKQGTLYKLHFALLRIVSFLNTLIAKGSLSTRRVPWYTFAKAPVPISFYMA